MDQLAERSPENNRPGIKKTLTAGIWYTLSSVITKGASMLLAPLYTRLMTLVEYGFNSTIGAWFSMMGTIVTGNLASSVNRAKYEFPGRLDAFISSATFLGSLITLVCYILVLIFQDFFCGLFGCQIEFFHIMFAVWLLSPALSMLQEKNRLENKYKLAVTLSLGSFAISSFFNVLMLVSEGFRKFTVGSEYAANRVLSMYLGSNIPLILCYLFIYCSLLKKGRTLINKRYWTYALALSLPLIPHFLSGYILNNSDRIMITKFCGEEYTALYSVTYTCSAAVSMVFNALNQAWVPWFNDKYFYQANQTIKKTTTVYYILFFVVTVGLLLLGPEMLAIFGGRKYAEAISIMPVVMASCFFQFSNAFFVNIEMFEKKTMRTAAGTFIAAMLNVALNFTFIPLYGYQAAAYTTFAGFAFLFFYHYFTCRRLIGKKLQAIYPTGMMKCCLLLITLFIPLMLLLYSSTLVRVTVILCLLVAAGFLLYKNRSSFMALLREIMKKE